MITCHREEYRVMAQRKLIREERYAYQLFRERGRVGERQTKLAFPCTGSIHKCLQGPRLRQAHITFWVSQVDGKEPASYFLPQVSACRHQSLPSNPTTDRECRHPKWHFVHHKEKCSHQILYGQAVKSSIQVLMNGMKKAQLAEMCSAWPQVKCKMLTGGRGEEKLLEASATTHVNCGASLVIVTATLWFLLPFFPLFL